MKVIFQLGWMLVPFLTAGCGSVQMKAARGESGLGSADPQNSMPPACVALLATSPNGDRLIQALSLDKSEKGCLGSSTYPAVQIRKENEWLVSSDTATTTTVRYRVLQAHTCMYVLEVQQNFGGSFTTGELLVLETGRTAVEGLAPKTVLTLLKTFAVSQVEQAKSFAQSAATGRTCAL
ncbi:hypothetical protein [Pseudomonas wadenswilerensis]|uniref:hypothetical protein n=1 Tax=Pseudomonas wadenswilerensis TaxID=1785161 RepID=UPI0011E5C182|nr:hypothetical protein [Pseudomonas wadenswilerensis]